MLPFTLSLLKCSRCDFTKRLRLLPTKVHKIKLRNNFFRKIDDDLLMSLRESFKDIDDCYKWEDDERLFLFGNVVDDGAIVCDNCHAIYDIRNGIIDFKNVRKDGVQCNKK